MEYQELIEAVAGQTKYTKREIRKIMRLVARTIREAMGRGRDVQYHGLGRFVNVLEKARKGRNRYTGEAIIIPPRRRVRFRPNEVLRIMVAQSQEVFKEPDLRERFGLKKGANDGKVRSGDRPKEGANGKEGRGGG